MTCNINTAFFDFDETVIDFKSMFSFLEFFLKKKYSEVGVQRFISYMDDVKNKWKNNFPRESINLDYYHQFKGETQQDILEIAQCWIIEQKKIYGANLYINETLKLIKEYQQQNISIVIVSGSLQDIIVPLAKDIGVDTVIATRMVIVDGLYTGEIIPPQTIGMGKALAIATYMQQHNIAKEQTIAWGDHDSDFPMLEASGAGGIISSNTTLLNEAQQRGFRVINRKYINTNASK